MIHLILTDEAQSRHRRLPFFLAMEEWAARELPADEYFFTWTVDPTVIIGRNQDLQAEVDEDYCRRKGIEIARRRSGGGCVYADRDNIMMSYIAPRVDVEGTFTDYTRLICRALGSIGIEAAVSGRNDITVGDRKISGSAFYHLPGRSIVHGTMLFDTDLENMMNAITPSRAKLESNKVKSVESRITTVRTLCPGITLAVLNDALVSAITDDARVVTTDELAAIEAIENRYYDPHWIRNGRSRGTVRIEGVGDIAIIRHETSGGKISGFDIVGDPFIIGDTGPIEEAIFGARADAAELTGRLAAIDVGKVVRGLSNSDFVNLLLAEPALN